MTRGKLVFMFVGLCVVAILLWIASVMKPAPPVGQSTSTAEPPAAGMPGEAGPAVIGDIYVTGHVNRSGMFTLRNGETIRDAVKDAGGADAPPSDLIVRLVRKDNQNTSTRSTPLKEIESGQSDEKVQRGDIITVVEQIKPATLQVPPAMGGAGVVSPTGGGGTP